MFVRTGRGASPWHAEEWNPGKTYCRGSQIRSDGAHRFTAWTLGRAFVTCQAGILPPSGAAGRSHRTCARRAGLPRPRDAERGAGPSSCRSLRSGHARDRVGPPVNPSPVAWACSFSAQGNLSINSIGWRPRRPWSVGNHPRPEGPSPLPPELALARGRGRNSASRGRVSFTSGHQVAIPAPL